MGKSPNRKDTAYAMALFSDEIKVSDRDIEKIEKTCGIQILKKDREYLNRLLDNYRTNKKLEENSSTRGEQIEALKKIMTASGVLNELFSDEGNHAIRRVKHRIEDNFSKTIEKYGFDLKARWDIFFQPHTSRTKTL